MNEIIFKHEDDGLTLDGLGGRLGFGKDKNVSKIKPIRRETVTEPGYYFCMKVDYANTLTFEAIEEFDPEDGHPWRSESGCADITTYSEDWMIGPADLSMPEEP